MIQRDWQLWCKACFRDGLISWNCHVTLTVLLNSRERIVYLLSSAVCLAIMHSLPTHPICCFSGVCLFVFFLFFFVVVFKEFLGSKRDLKFAHTQQHGSCTEKTIWLTHWPLGPFNQSLDVWILKVNLVIDGWGTSYEIALNWMTQDSNGKSTLFQVMAWCCQAASHYLGQYWPRSVVPYSITRPQWVNNLAAITN